MDHAHATTRQARIAARQHDAFPLAALPDDVLPNVFSRLPVPEIFQLCCVSTRLLHCSRPLMREWAVGELHATREPRGELRWPRLLDVMRNGLGQLAPRYWNDWLQATKAQDQAAVLAQMARLAPCISGDAESAALVSSTGPLWLDRRALRELTLLAIGSRVVPWMGEAAVAIIAGAMLQLIRIESDGAESEVVFMHRAVDWVRVIGCIPGLGLANQIRVLAQAAPASQDEEQVGHGLDLPWQLHVDAMRKGLRTPWPADVLQPRRTATYFRMLRRQAQDPRDDRRLAMERLLSAWFRPGFKSAPWREQPPELSECLLVAIANGPKRNVFNEILCARMVASGFIRAAEMADFTNHVFNRCDGIDPVCEWMLDNRERRTKATACTIS
jgi:hypothetical protein